MKRRLTQNFDYSNHYVGEGYDSRYWVVEYGGYPLFNYSNEVRMSLSKAARAVKERLKA